MSDRFALMAFAGELAIRYQVLPWPEGDAIKAVMTCFKAWLDDRGGAGSSDAEQMIQQVRRFLETHGLSRFTSGRDEYTKAVNHAGHRTEDEFWILPEVFRSEVCLGYDPRLVARELRDRGYLAKIDGNNLAYPVTIPGLGKVRAYRVLKSILE